MSSLSSSSPAFMIRVLSSPLRKAFTNPRSKPCWWVPPLGVAMMLTNDCSTVS